MSNKNDLNGTIWEGNGDWELFWVCDCDEDTNTVCNSCETNKNN